MKFKILAVVGLACAMAGACASYVEHAPTGENWVGFDEGDAKGGFWPKAAAKQGLEGWARLLCTVGSDGRLHNCEVLTESPLGWGFGEAALRMREGFQLRSDPVGRGEKLSLGVFFCRDAFSACGWAAYEEEKRIEQMRQERDRSEKLRA